MSSMKNLSYTKCILRNEHYKTTRELVSAAPIYEGSHRKLQANEVGFLGEVVAMQWLRRSGIAFEDRRELTTHDLLIEGQYTLDIKTKDRTVKPLLHFDNSVPLYNHEHQQPDWYLFVSLLRDKRADQNDLSRFREAYLVGAIDFATLEDVGKVWKAGETDPDNGTTFWTSCINVSMDQLTPLREACAAWNGTGV